MTAVRRVRSAAAGLGFYLGLAALIAIVLVLVATGVLSERRWGPFGDVRVWRFILEGLLVTLQIGAVALVASLILAVPLALARLALPRPFRWIVVTWIELVRATPVLALILFLTLYMPRDLVSSLLGGNDRADDLHERGALRDPASGDPVDPER